MSDHLAHSDLLVWRFERWARDRVAGGYPRCRAARARWRAATPVSMAYRVDRLPVKASAIQTATRSRSAGGMAAREGTTRAASRRVLSGIGGSRDREGMLDVSTDDPLAHEFTAAKAA